MDGRTFLDVARQLVKGPGEAYWRTAAGRCYYALLWEGWAALEGWGLPVPPHSVHFVVRLRLLNCLDPDLRAVGRRLEALSTLRNFADYKRNVPGPFTTAAIASQAVKETETALQQLDLVGADAARVRVAVADIRARRP